MKKLCLISSLVAISAVMGGMAHAGTITDSESHTYTIATNGTESGTNANVIATYQATEAAIESAWNTAEAWIGQELGYNTTTTDAKTVLHAAGFAADDFLGAVTENKTAIAGKQDALTTAQLSAVNSGITADKVSTYDGYATTIAGKQDALTTAQLSAVNSGITADKVSTYDGYATTIAGKQDALTTAQLSAVNSGITADKVSTYDGYATSKQDTLTTEQLAAVNSGITSALVGQITTNKNDIATLNGKVGSATFTGTNATGAADLTAAVNSLDSAIGNRAYTSTNVITSGTNVATALSALDAKVGGAVTSTNYIAGANTINANLSALDARAKTNADNIGNLAYVNNASVNYGVIAANTNLTTAVSQVASNIGPAVTGTNGNVLGTNTVNANLDRIDTKMGNLTAITHNAFGGASTNITGAVNALATNIAAVTGGTYATDGSWSSTIVNTGAVKYQNNVSVTNLMGAVNQVASNIGSWVTSTNNIGVTNTVNQNLSALDAAIGNRNYTNEYNIADADTVTASLEKLDTVIGDYGNLANTNSNLSGTDLKSDLDMIDTVIGNRVLASSNSAINSAVATDLASAFNTTGNLIGDMDFAGTRYVSTTASLSDAVRSLDNNLSRVEHEFHKAEYNLKSGLAAMSAMSALVPNARDCGDTQVSVGTGVYADRIGLALGGFHYFNDHVLMNIGASYGGTRDWAFRAGVTFGLGL